MNDYLRNTRLKIDLRKTESGLVRMVRRIPLVGTSLGEKYGLNEIPTSDLPIRRGELLLNHDNTMLEFDVDGGGFCGVTIIPGDDKNITTHRAIMEKDGNKTAQTIIPEGQFQIGLHAPPPIYDAATDDFVFYSAQVLVMGDVGDRFVSGTNTAFTSSGKLIQWLVLNEWSQYGVAKSAFRLVRGIEFPGQKQEEVPLLRLHALGDDTASSLSPDAVKGSGIVVVQFVRDIREGKFKKKKYIVPPDLLLDHNLVTSPVTLKSTTALMRETTSALTTGRSDEAIAIGPTILIEVNGSSNPPQLMRLVGPTSVTIHRKDNATDPALEAMASWGIPAAKEKLTNGK